MTFFSFALQSDSLSGTWWLPTSKSGLCCARWVGAFFPLGCLEGWGAPRLGPQNAATLPLCQGG